MSVPAAPVSELPLRVMLDKAHIEFAKTDADPITDA